MSKDTSNSSLEQLSLFDLIQIPLTKGQIAIVDPIDIDLLNWKWFALKGRYTFYACRNTSVKEIPFRKFTLLHRTILMRILNRSLGDHEYVDHLDGNGLNNTRNNLRLADKKQNNGNTGLRSDNTSGFKGVRFLKKKNKWVAEIHSTHLGTFNTPEEAHAAYCEAAKQYFGEFARF